MKKFLLILCALIVTLPVCAQTIGTVNYKEVVTNYTKAKQIYSELDDKATELQRYLLDKEKEYKKLESPIQQKTFEEQTAKAFALKQDAFAKLRQTKEQEIDKDVEAAIKAVALENKIDVVMDYRVLYMGGVDITDKVVKKLNLK
jgi:outer membrane protein